MDAGFRPDGGLDLTPETIGVGQASTFKGFCSTHDTELFSPIENSEVDLTDDGHRFLILYRSIAKEYRESEHAFNALRSFSKAEIPQLSPDDIRIGVLVSLMYIKYCEFHWIKNIKNVLDCCLTTGISQPIFEHRTRMLDRRYPLLVTSAYAVQGSFNSIVFEKNVTTEMPLICSLSVLPGASETRVLFSYLKEQENELAPYLESFETPQDIEFANVLSEMVLRNCENLYLDPTYWEALSPDDRTNIADFFFRTINDREFPYDRRKHSLLKNINSYSKGT
jgi:hypothetical protein